MTLPRLADFVAGIGGGNKRQAWQRYVDTLPIASTQAWNDLLSALPDSAWATLRESTLRQIDQRDPTRGLLQAQDRFNEVRAFIYLQKIGCSDITFAPASMEQRGPDLLAHRDGQRIACEVKCLRLKSGSAHIARKLASRLQDAALQLARAETDQAYIYLIAAGMDVAALRSLIDMNPLSPCRLILDSDGAIEMIN